VSPCRTVAALLAKEARILRLPLAIGLPFVLLQAMTFLMWSRGAYLGYMVAATLAFALAGAFLDHRYRVDPLFASLPIPRDVAVAARYLWCALVVAVMLGVTVGAARMTTVPGPEGTGAREAIAFLSATMLPLASFLPFHYRWGFGAGSARYPILLGIVAAVGAGAGVLARAAGTDLVTVARAALEQAISALGPAACVLVAALLLAALGFLSYLLSVRFYARRDL
jgi:hypothetical protein